MLCSFCGCCLAFAYFFWQFQPGVACKSVTYKKACISVCLKTITKVLLLILPPNLQKFLQKKLQVVFVTNVNLFPRVKSLSPPFFNGSDVLSSTLEVDNFSWFLQGICSYLQSGFWRAASLNLYPHYFIFATCICKNLACVVALHENCPDTEFFLVRIFPHSEWVRRDIQSECGKIRTRKNSVFEHFSRWT